MVVPPDEPAEFGCPRPGGELVVRVTSVGEDDGSAVADFDAQNGGVAGDEGNDVPDLNVHNGDCITRV